MLLIKNLCVKFNSNGEIFAVKDFTLDLKENKTTVMIGETGSGKSVILLAILKLLPETANVIGEVKYNGDDLLLYHKSRIKEIRKNHIAYIPQGNGNAMNPLLKIGYQAGETLIYNEGYNKINALEKVRALLEKFNFKDTQRVINSYPHMLSGGMRQRVLIAMGTIGNADIILADEPTKGLDENKIDAISRLFCEMQGKTILCVSHDLNFTRSIANYIVVLYSAVQVEYCSVEDFYNKPLHPYSVALLKSQPENGLQCDVRFAPPKEEETHESCIFYESCKYRLDKCKVAPPMFEVGERLVRCWIYEN